MQDDIEELIDLLSGQMEDTVEHLKSELLKIRAGKASPAMVSGVMVNYYGAPTPLPQVANVSAVDSRTIAIQPWDKSIINVIEKAIIEANLGYNPMNDGEFIRIPVPPLTEERRKMLVKQAKALGEDGKVSIRNVRKDGMDEVKKAVKDGYPEDAGKRLDTKIEALVKKYYESIDELITLKEKDILTI